MTSAATVAEPGVHGDRAEASRVLFACLALILVTGLALRVWNVSSSPPRFHPTRQYAGLALAKEWSGVGRHGGAEAAIEANGRSVPRLEPRILEAVVAGAYMVFGEVKWVGGAVSSLAWIGGGACLFLLSRRLSSTPAAWAATAFYLFLPYGLEASRSFQPDPAMVAFFVAAVLAVVRYAEDRSTRRLVLAAGLAGIAVLLKFVCVFAVAGAFVAVVTFRDGLRGLLRRTTVVYAAIGVLPAASYYAAGIIGNGQLSNFASTGFLPSLWFEDFYWRGWLRLIDATVGLWVVAPALLSVVVARHPLARRLMAGLLVGYVAFGLAFNYHIHTHDYYQLQLIPIVGLGLGLTVDAVFARIRQRQWSGLAKVAVAASMVVLGAAVAVADLRVARRGSGANARRHIADAAVIGKLVGHSPRTVALAPAYGRLLFYEGSLSGAAWPTGPDFRFRMLQGERVKSTAELFDELTRGADWFVVTDLDELKIQSELWPLLDDRGQLVAQTAGYLVYDLRATDRAAR